RRRCMNAGRRQGQAKFRISPRSRRNTTSARIFGGRPQPRTRYAMAASTMCPIQVTSIHLEGDFIARTAIISNAAAVTRRRRATA
ncbi:MAG TPA: hypothetical protein VLJ39_02960, partial [Tepidisphaeraceae bacterium]|nr:hypothetical protein [Tepidisphaeraceae bacterium]